LRCVRNSNNSYDDFEDSLIILPKKYFGQAWFSSEQARAQAQAQAQVALLPPLSECIVFFYLGYPGGRLFFFNWSF
jgi:hypothetical protein